MSEIEDARSNMARESARPIFGERLIQPRSMSLRMHPKDSICDAASAHLPNVEAFFSPRIAERPGSPEIPVILGYKNMVTFDLVCRAGHWGRGPVAGRSCPSEFPDGA